ncbi:hypothetical protein [Saccharothrix deserti]|uniref:hypothetical protein n=1 Tax=Saccharothrix deserti TaxID=2593674 RepID=UPI00131BCB71|nr:hypothetical protein [Saccharothrix deserti]
MLLGNAPKPDVRKLKAVAALVLVGVGLGAMASFGGRWIAEGLAGTYTVRAVVSVYDSETVESQDGPDTFYTVEARAEDGRAISLPGNEEFGITDPVVVRLSSLTHRVLSVRGADALVKSHDRVWKAVPAVAGVVAVLFAGWMLVAGRRVISSGLGPRGVLAAVVCGAVIAGFVLLSPSGFGRGAFIDSTGPVPDLSGRYSRGGEPPTVERGGVVRNEDFTLRASDVRRGAPEGAAAWLSEFEVVTVRVEATRLTDFPIPLELRADEHGRPGLVRDCAGAPGAFDHESVVGRTVTGLVCFVVPQGYQPTQLVVGQLEQRVMLTL